MHKRKQGQPSGKNYEFKDCYFMLPGCNLAPVISHIDEYVEKQELAY